MSTQRVIQFGILVLISCLTFAETELGAPDRIEIEGGVILTGYILEASADSIQLETDYAGTIKVSTDKVLKIHTSKQLSSELSKDLIAATKPAAKASADETKPPPPGATKAPVKSASEPPDLATKAPVKKTPEKKPDNDEDDKYGWEVDIGMNLTGNNGNSEKLDFALNIDTRYVQKFYRVDLYGRYSYAENRERLSSNEIILGSRYTNFFYKKFGFFIREELEHDKFELIDLRSTTAGGFSYKIYDKKNLDLEARSGLSYRYEKDAFGDTEDYPGMDFGADIRWQFNPVLNFKGSYSFIPSFNDSEEFIITQDSGIEIPLNRRSLWKIRLGLTTKYNNEPKRNRENMDHKYYVRLQASWK